MALVTTQWLSKNKHNVKIIDSSWHLPNTRRNGYLEYSKEHITNAIYFDIDKYSDQNSKLPHMLPNKERWEEIMSSIGISNKDKVVVYDNSEVLSSCRLWYTFLYFGHNKNLIYVLDGGLDKWKKDYNQTTNKINSLNKTNYTATENKAMVKNISQIKENIINENFKIIDGRSKDRFDGKIEEPRKGLRSGSIKNSFCLPFSELINEDHTFASKDKIMEKFKSLKFDNDKNIVFSCGSGVTASVLALAYSLINAKYMPTIYDGSWAEYGKN